MADLIQPALDWLTATGAPNWIVLLAILTTPTLWSRKVVEVVNEFIASVKNRFG